MSKTLIQKAEELLIIGYSFGDRHYNIIFEEWLKNRNQKGRLIHIRPNNPFPYPKSNKEVINLQNITGLSRISN